jgi:hypothetical protein
MRPGKSWTVALLLGVTVAFVIILNATPPSPVLLTDGTFVIFHSVTRGTNHVAHLGKMHQQLLASLPSKWVPRKWMKGMTVTTNITATNAVVVWVHLSNGRGDLHYCVTDANGVGAFRSQFVTIPRWAEGLYPLALQQWPRSADKIGITFYGENVREILGSIVINNPASSAIDPYIAQPLPAVDRNEELELTLVSLEVRPGGKTFSSRAGNWWASRATFTVTENGSTNQDWVVHSLSLSDAGGNRRRSTGPRAWNGNVFEIFTDPLFLAEGAWKIEVDLTRSANFRPEDTVMIPDVPMPLKDGPGETVFRTNLLGHALTLRSMKSAHVSRSGPRRGHSIGGPGFAVELDSPSHGLVPKVAGIWNERGESMPVPGHGYGEGYALMRFSAPKGAEPPKTLRVQATLQLRREFTFFAEPKIVD